MPDRINTPNVHEAAQAYVRLGWPIIPLRGKVPAIQGWQTFIASEVNLRLWFLFRQCNVGLRTGESGYIVVDSDTERAEEWARERLPTTPMSVRTGGGSTHRYFAAPPRKEIRNRQGWKQIDGLDVRGGGGLITLPPSKHPETNKRYEWASEIWQPAGLPTFSPAWVYQRRTRREVREVVAGDLSFVEFRARRWLEVRECAVSGQGGHNRTFATACKLVLYFGLDRQTAIRLMLTVFNPKCRPPWSVKEIEHKVEDALKKRS